MQSPACCQRSLNEVPDTFTLKILTICPRLLPASEKNCRTRYVLAFFHKLLRTGWVEALSDGVLTQSRNRLSGSNCRPLGLPSSGQIRGSRDRT